MSINGEKLSLSTGTAGASIMVDRKKASAYVPPPGAIRIRSQGPDVWLLIGDKILELTTPVAMKIAFALVGHAKECEGTPDFVVLAINGEELHLLPAIATQIGGALVKKADKADDWQRGIKGDLQ